MMVETSREDARLDGDLADRGRLEALACEEFGGELHEVVAALGGGARGRGSLPPHRGGGGGAGVLSLVHAFHYEPLSKSLFTKNRPDNA